MNTPEISIVTRVLRSSDGYLVQCGRENEVEVLGTSEGLKCDCFIASVSPDGRCQHIEAIENEITTGAGFSNTESLSQADADYYLGKLAKLDHSIEGNQESANAQVWNINQWLEQENAKLKRQKSYYTLALESWMLVNELTSKRLVHGAVSLRKQQPEIEIIDEDAVLKDERFVRVVPEKLAINKAALRQHVVNTGEEIPGISVHLRDVKFSYKTNATPTGANHGLE
jgi:hypothetical protein